MKFILAISSALLACSTSLSNQLPPMSSEISQPSPAVLQNSYWRLERWEREGSAVALVPQAAVSLHFQDQQVDGFAGCNNFAGSFNLTNNQLSIGALDATQKGCAAPVMNQENQFLSALQSASRYSLDTSGRLSLFYGSDASEGVLYFVPTKK